MKKGKSRRYREAREFKQADHLAPIEGFLAAEEPAEQKPCVECNRSPHADWCMAEAS